MEAVRIVIVVATTLAAYVMDDQMTWGAWLYNAEAMTEHEREQGREVRFFAAIETDRRGLAPFDPLLERLRVVNGLAAGGTGAPDLTPWWTYHLDDGREQVTTANRLRHITMGQNLASDYATSVGATHMLFMAADCSAPADAISKLIEVGWPIVGGHVSTYCLDGPEIWHHPLCAIRDTNGNELVCDCHWRAMDVRAHMPTAALVLLQRDLFKQVKWRWDNDLGLSDDPAMYHDAEHLFGFDPPAVVRHDVVGRHYPDSIGAIETRGHDMRVAR